MNISAPTAPGTPHEASETIRDDDRLAPPSRDTRVIGLIMAGHFTAHFHMITVPPLFVFLAVEFNATYTMLGFALTLFNIGAGVAQVPWGFLVDRFGPRIFLVGGLAVEGAALIAIGLIDQYMLLLGLMLIVGIANSVFHPCDYTILAANVREERMGRAFSFHTFAGYAGGAAAPAGMLLLYDMLGWRGAVIASGLMSFAVILPMLANWSLLDGTPRNRAAGETAPATGGGKTGLGLLFSLPVLMSWLFFLAIALSGNGMNNFSIPALKDRAELALSLPGLEISTLTMAGFATTAYLVGSAVGILGGGWIADRTPHHERVAAAGFTGAAVLVALVGLVSFSGPVLFAVMLIAGLMVGMIMPSRDMLVRAITPPGATGKVFGFVSTGFNAGGALMPLVLGSVMDAGKPAWIFLIAAGCMIFAVGTVFAARASRPSGAA